MTKERDDRIRLIAEAVTWMARPSYSTGTEDGLTPSQYMALRYFSRANRFSLTVSAFADYHTTTRGTASVIVKGLVEQGYLSRTQSLTDARSARLDVTAKGEAAVKKDPFWRLVRAVGHLPNAAQRRLASDLDGMMSILAEELERSRFGRCADCKHLVEDGSCSKGPSPYECGFLDVLLKKKDLEKICVNFEPR